MDECAAFVDPVTVRELVDDRRVREHIERCSRCREQLEIDRELGELFEGIARPGPSLHSDRVLRKRLHAEGLLRRRNRLCLILMQACWVAAAGASAIVIMLVRWPRELPSMQVLSCSGAVLGFALLTPLILLRSLRMGPIKLILSTIEVFRR